MTLVANVATRTDPVGAIKSFEYDAMGDLTRHIDRKGQIAFFAYDALSRRTGGSYADGTSTGFVYDAVGILIQATDSVGGTIANQYDALNRLVAQITNLGTVSYQYDAAGRRTRMNTPGQTPVTYGYDAASRLRQVVQGSQAVDLTYDALGRRTRLMLPNGVSTEYQYDTASRLTDLIYRNALGTLGDLTYQYDRAGNRTGVGGTFARTLLPDPISSATYDAANRQLQFGDKSMSFDANGNVASISDFSGTTMYSWDARNRLIGLNGPTANGSFAYDVLGRRRERTINAQRVNYVYDAVNPVQETSGATVLANIFTGLGIDEYFARTDVVAGTTSHFLSEALGSAVALVDAAGALQTEYTYEPFGRTTVTGASSGNFFQYTGRENDTPGLYYFRARYYQPVAQRFISEDPIEFGGGDINFYSYVGNKPITLIDPFGLDKQQRSFLKRVWDNYKLTNETIPGLYAPVGLGFVSAGYTADALETITLLKWVRSGFTGATLAGATFTGLETGILALSTAGINFVAISGAFEGGVLIGSVISALIDDPHNW